MQSDLKRGRSLARETMLINAKRASKKMPPTSYITLSVLHATEIIITTPTLIKHIICEVWLSITDATETASLQLSGPPGAI